VSIRSLSAIALLILREKVLKPALAGVYYPKRGRPPKNVLPLTFITTLSNAKYSPPSNV
jgi:hypothetical protein